MLSRHLAEPCLALPALRLLLRWACSLVLGMFLAKDRAWHSTHCSLRSCGGRIYVDKMNLCTAHDSAAQSCEHAQILKDIYHIRQLWMCARHMPFWLKLCNPGSNGIPGTARTCYCLLSIVASLNCFCEQKFRDVICWHFGGFILPTLPPLNKLSYHCRFAALC